MYILIYTLPLPPPVKEWDQKTVSPGGRWKDERDLLHTYGWLFTANEGNERAHRTKACRFHSETKPCSKMVRFESVFSVATNCSPVSAEGQSYAGGSKNNTPAGNAGRVRRSRFPGPKRIRSAFQIC